MTLAVFASAIPMAFADSWEYREDVDKMTSKTTAFATLSSINSLSLSFPYKGSNYGQLMVRKHPQYGLHVMVSIDKGQILCPTYSGCSVQVRFGNRPPVTFQGSAPADHSSTSVFIRGAQGFIEHAKKAKSIKVQLNVYQSGAEVLEFDSDEPLVWGPKVKPAK